MCKEVHKENYKTYYVNSYDNILIYILEQLENVNKELADILKQNILNIFNN